MTREEAITVLKTLMKNPLFSEVHKVAFNIAIHDIKQRHDWDINNLILINKDDYEPLEQEPCEDAVSRKSVITIIQNHWWNCRDIDKLVNELPSVTPQFSSGLEKNSKKLEKDFGELDCISRIETIDYLCKHCPDDGECFKDCDEIKHLRQMPSVTPQEQIEKCTWIKYDYRTVCPKEHDIDNPYWRIPENRMETLKYCPYCGKEIEVEEWKEKKQ